MNAKTKQRTSALKTRANKKRGRRDQLRRGLSVESLEARRVMAASIAFTAPGELTITADPHGTQAYVTDLDPTNNPQNLNDYYIIRATSDDGTVGFAIHKGAVQSMRFVGSDAADRYQAQTGIGWNWIPLSHHVDARGGDDIVFTGAGADTVLGGSGRDEIHGGGGNDTLSGGGDRDRIWGDSGSDTLKGDSGVDDLYGGSQDDVIYGGSGADWIEGNDGNDLLYGESGVDFLYGGRGVDGLYGGSGADQLHGGPDSDRFLIRTNETGTHKQTFDGNDIFIADNILDDTAEDIRVRFTNEGARTVTWGAGVTPSSTRYTAGAWSESEIMLVNEALGTIAETTGNNALLYHSSGGEPQMFRLGNASNQYIGFNDAATGDTHYSNQSFTDDTGGFNEDWAVQVVLHEYGHNFDTREEAAQLLGVYGEAIVDVFRDASGWTQTRPADPWNYNRSRDGNWWYRKDAEEVRWYDKTNPQEDFAETFSAYFMDVAGREFQDGPGAAGAPTKVHWMDILATYAGYLGSDGRPRGARESSGMSAIAVGGGVKPVKATMSAIQIAGGQEAVHSKSIDAGQQEDRGAEITAHRRVDAAAGASRLASTDVHGAALSEVLAETDPVSNALSGRLI